MLPYLPSKTPDHVLTNLTIRKLEEKKDISAAMRIEFEKRDVMSRDLS